MQECMALKEDEILVVRGKRSFLLAGRVGTAFPLCVETPADEYCQTLSPGDLVAVSAPEGGSLRAAWMLLELVRKYHVPLIVLPGSHPGSRRLRYVVSAGEMISLSCTIRRGTHPEQHLLCSSEELAGIFLKGTRDGVVIQNCPDGVLCVAITAPDRADPDPDINPLQKD